MQTYEIIPRLYQRGHMRHLPKEVKLAELDRLGVRAVVNLVGRVDADLADARGLLYIQYPIPDNKLKAFDRMMLELIAVQLSTIMYNGWSVLIHCNAGRNRASLLSAMVVRQHRGCSLSAAAALVMRQRPNALANREFLAYLEGR